jgi:polyisoprenoid-binding protein YceI
MKKLAATLATLLPVLSFAAPATFNLDASHSTAGFAVKHLVISSVRGEFRTFSGVVQLDDADPTKSTVEATIDVNSLDTHVADRDAHLKSPDFFDTAKFPTVTFKSTKVAKAGKDALKVTGDLTLHGVTRPVTLDVKTSPEVKGMFGETRRAFAATTKISRKDFGLTWNAALEAGGVLVSDKVLIALDVSIIKG